MSLAGRSPCFVMCGDDICRDHGCRHVYKSPPQVEVLPNDDARLSGIRLTVAEMDALYNLTQDTYTGGTLDRYWEDPVLAGLHSKLREHYIETLG